MLLIMYPLLLLAQVNNYTLEGKTNNPATFTLQYLNDGQLTKNSAVTKNGEITLSGIVDTKTQASLMIIPDNSSGSKAMGLMVRFWLEPGHIQISHLDSVGKISFSGTPLNDDQNELTHRKQTISGKPAGKEHDEMQKVIVIQFIKEHPNSLVSLMELNFNLSQGIPDLSIVEPLFNSLSTDLKTSFAGKAYQLRIDNWKKVDVGSIAPDFTQPDKNGKAVKLSDFKGKYIFLDFWASWCHPCRGENPNLIKQYNLYKAKNFIIVSISLDGGTQEAKQNWLRAITQDKVGIWPQLCDLSDDKTNKVRQMYNVGSIPENFLIGPDGKIIAKSLRGEELNKKLKEIFDK
jgi:peroxiredoxin